MLCNEWSLVNRDRGIVTIVPLKCRCWTCDYCHDFRKAELIENAIRGRPNTFITLTINPGQPGDESAHAQALAHAWRRVVRAAKRKYKYRSIPFLAVFETTKAGEPHLHILARVPWIDQGWLSKEMANQINSPIVDIRRISSRRAIVNYIAKYVGKEPHRFKHSKRYWSTRDYQLWRKDRDRADLGNRQSWVIYRASVAFLAEMQEGFGCTVTWEGRSATSKPPDDNAWFLQL